MKETANLLKGYARRALSRQTLPVAILLRRSAGGSVATMILPSASRPKRIRAMTHQTLTESAVASARYSYQSLHLKKATHHLTNLVTMRIVLASESNHQPNLLARAKIHARVQKIRKGSENVAILLLDKSDLKLLRKIKLNGTKNTIRIKKSESKSVTKNASNAKNLKD